MSAFPHRWYPVYLLGLVAVAAAVGCGGTKKVTVTGTVSYKGQPVTAGMVQFVGAPGTAPAGGLIKNDGTFTVTDVTPGEVKVSFLATPPSSKDPPGPKVTTVGDLPEKYRDAEKSGLKYTITPDTTKLDIKID
jgi:hypothetical protein